MSDHSKIEWTDATWNPIVGCSIVSPGCTNCYAMRLAGTRLRDHSSRQGLTTDTKAGPVWNGEVRFNEEWLTQPLKWKRPRMIFVCAHGDLFYEAVPDEWIDRVFAVMALAPQHTFQVLTKRAERMKAYFETSTANQSRQADIVACAFELNDALGESGGEQSFSDKECLVTLPLPNAWLGISAEDQARADERIPLLLDTPAAVRFVSLEPLLGPIDLRAISTAGIGAAAGNKLSDCLHWVILGGESGPGARPMHPQWARSIRDQCAAAGVPFFFKQWGEYLPLGQILPGSGKVHGATAVKPGRMKLHYGGTPEQAPKHAFAERGVEIASTADGRLTFRVGKKRAGRLLDGVEHNGMPTVAFT